MRVLYSPLRGSVNIPPLLTSISKNNCELLISIQISRFITWLQEAEEESDEDDDDDDTDD